MKGRSKTMKIIILFPLTLLALWPALTAAQSPLRESLQNDGDISVTLRAVGREAHACELSRRSDWIPKPRKSEPTALVVVCVIQITNDGSSRTQIRVPDYEAVLEEDDGKQTIAESAGFGLFLRPDADLLAGNTSSATIVFAVADAETGIDGVTANITKARSLTFEVNPAKTPLRRAFSIDDVRLVVR
jgi:hypothetical protein